MDGLVGGRVGRWMVGRLGRWIQQVGGFVGEYVERWVHRCVVQ